MGAIHCVCHEVILYFMKQIGLPAQSNKVRMAITVELLLTFLQAGDDIVIGDAGGGTIDVSAVPTKRSPKQLLL